MQEILNLAINAIGLALVQGSAVYIIINFIKGFWCPTAKLIPWLAILTGIVTGEVIAYLQIATKPETIEVWLWYVIYGVAGILSSQVARKLWEGQKDAAWHVQDKLSQLDYDLVDELTDDEVRQLKERLGLHPQA